uniref:Putative secreted protein n=1 Tax=Anopheles darlingi TaxID=43151 RepID=A0A2M4D1W8_ANODA
MPVRVSVCLINLLVISNVSETNAIVLCRQINQQIKVDWMDFIWSGVPARSTNLHHSIFGRVVFDIWGCTA